MNNLHGKRPRPGLLDRNYAVTNSADAMSAFFSLLHNETDPRCVSVHGHSLFVHIHPDLDGTGCMGRFLMSRSGH
jgi:hypothetical protein